MFFCCVEIGWRFCFTRWRAQSRLTCRTRVPQIRFQNKIEIEFEMKKKLKTETRKNVKNCWFQEIWLQLFKFSHTKKTFMFQHPKTCFKFKVDFCTLGLWQVPGCELLGMEILLRIWCCLTLTIETWFKFNFALWSLWHIEIFFLSKRWLGLEFLKNKFWF